MLDNNLQASLRGDNEKMKKEFEDFLRRIESERLSNTGAGKRLLELAEAMGYKPDSGIPELAVAGTKG